MGRFNFDNKMDGERKLTRYQQPSASLQTMVERPRRPSGLFSLRDSQLLRRILEQEDVMGELAWIGSTDVANQIKEGKLNLFAKRSLPDFIGEIIGHSVERVTRVRQVRAFYEVGYVPQRTLSDPEVLVSTSSALSETMKVYQRGLKESSRLFRQGDETRYACPGGYTKKHPHSGHAYDLFREAKETLAEEAVGELTKAEVAFALTHFTGQMARVKERAGRRGLKWSLTRLMSDAEKDDDDERW